MSAIIFQIAYVACICALICTLMRGCDLEAVNNIHYYKVNSQ